MQCAVNSVHQYTLLHMVYQCISTHSTSLVHIDFSLSLSLSVSVSVFFSLHSLEPGTLKYRFVTGALKHRTVAGALKHRRWKPGTLKYRTVTGALKHRTVASMEPYDLE